MTPSNGPPSRHVRLLGNSQYKRVRVITNANERLIISLVIVQFVSKGNLFRESDCYYNVVFIAVQILQLTIAGRAGQINRYFRKSFFVVLGFKNVFKT